MPFMEKLKKNKEEKKVSDDKIIANIRELYIQRKILEKEVHEINMKLDILIAMVKYKENISFGDDEIENIKL